MGTSALGGFATGLMQGMDHADQRRRNKAIDNLLDRDAYEKDLDIAARKEDWQKIDGNTLEDFPEFDNPTEQDPYLVRGFNWLKDKFRGWQGKDTTANVVETPTDEELEPSRSAIPAGRFMADGGKVEDEQRKKRTYGDYYVTEEEAAANREYRGSLPPSYQSPYSPYMRDKRGRLESGRKAIPTFTGTGPGLDMADIKEVGRDIASAAGGVFDDTIRTANTAREATDETGRAVKNAEGARETGTALRKHAVETGKAGLATGVAVGKDILLDNPVVQGILGFIGFDGKRDNRQPDPSTPPPVVDAGTKAAVDTAAGDEKPAGAIAADAVQKGVEMTPGHPDNPDQAFDWAEVASSGVRPEDIPHMGVSDWAEYRRRTARAAALRGQSVEEAMNGVTEMQMKGAQSNLMQAAFLLRSGDSRGAALAARAAFQYFPNGSDVKFGLYDSPDGPVLVGMGTDEETGEPIKGGRPMILTPETIAVMAENFSNPAAFRTWTKDWHEMAMKDREREEITKPLAEGKLNLMDAQADEARAGAARDRAAALPGASGGLKQSDYDRANATFLEQLDARGIAIDDPRLADSLAADMSTLYKQLGGRLQYPEIIDIVMSVHNEEKTLPDALREYGIDIGQ